MRDAGWAKVKGSLEACSKSQLIELLADLHKVSEEAGLFLGGRFVQSPVVDSTSGIGWGYHDALGDMFHEAFGREG